MRGSELSSGGKRMEDFLRDSADALGNPPREFWRTKLLEAYRRNLAHSKVKASDKFMEIDDGFIHWLFPLTRMGVNREAPVLTDKDYKILSEKPGVQDKMREHFKLFLSFMGVAYDETAGTMEKANAARWNSWLADHHNNLRVSRVLESMANFGLNKESEQFIQFLGKEAEREAPEIVRGHTFDGFDQFTQISYRRFWLESAKGTVRQKE